VRLILASSSPRRAELLRAAGFAFQVEPVDIDERLVPGEDPRTYVARLAREKSDAVPTRDTEMFVLGADTSVVVGNELLGKPADAEEATQMLRKLSGRAHEVLTGVAVRRGARAAHAVASTLVEFTTLSDADIEWYLASGEYDGKAGAYAIQGRASRFIDRIDGSYSNVVGLPVATVHRLLRELGFGG
jgi:septum formation protein